MAFATSNVQKGYLGNLKVTYGNWSGSVGDAPGTIGIEGGQIYLVSFQGQQASGPYCPETESSVSGTAGVVTLTVYNQANVTSGTFLIVSK